MAKIFPFRGLFFDPARVGSLDSVVAQPYDKIDDALRETYLARHPQHIVRISKGKDEPGDGEGTDKYARAGRLIDQWIAERVILRDPVPAIYVSAQEFKGPDGRTRVRRGFAALGQVEDFGKGGVHAHEKTLLAPKQDRYRLMTATRGLTEGHIFMLYHDPAGRVNRLLDEAAAGAPTHEARDDYGETHRLWRITDPERIRAIQREMERFDLFIADGHHRYEVALQYRDEMRRLGRKCEGTESFENRMMSYFNMADEGLVIFPTHRVVHALTNWEPKTFLAGLGEHFDVREYPYKDNGDEERMREEWLEDLRIEGQTRKAFGIALAGSRSYRLLLLKDPAVMDRVVSGGQSTEWKRLDVTIGTELILNVRLGITAEKLAKETHVHYIRHAADALAMVRSGQAQLALLLNPTRLEEVRVIAAKGERMPQKSTDFYPKLLSGFVMNRVNFVS